MPRAIRLTGSKWMYSCFSLKDCCCNVSLEAPPPHEEINISPDCVNLQLLKSGLVITNKKCGPDAQTSS